MIQNIVKVPICDQPVEKIMWLCQPTDDTEFEDKDLKKKSKENRKLKNRKTFTADETENLNSMQKNLTAFWN